MGLLWLSHGIPAGLRWESYGIPVGILWDYFGIPVVFPRDCPGIPMVFSTGFQWIFFRIIVRFLCDSYGTSRASLKGCSGILVGFLWDSYGLSVVLPWSAYEIPIELLYCFIEVFT